jgi:hypothetical protein
MKIEHFEPSAQDGPAILIYGNEPEAVETLIAAVHTLSQGSQERVAVHQLPGFESVDGCELFLAATKSDRGVRLIAPPLSFECSIRPLWWDNVLGLLEPFRGPFTSHHHQYLDYGWSSDFQLIISTHRGW